MVTLEEATMPSKVQESGMSETQTCFFQLQGTGFQQSRKEPSTPQVQPEESRKESVVGAIMGCIKNYKIINRCFQDSMFVVTCIMTETAKAPATASGTD